VIALTGCIVIHIAIDACIFCYDAANKTKTQTWLSDYLDPKDGVNWLARSTIHDTKPVHNTILRKTSNTINQRTDATVTVYLNSGTTLDL
jgi:hypothetical protein